MIKEQDLLDAIAECQGERNPNANTCIKLAAYYTIIDHLYPDNRDIQPQLGQMEAVMPVGDYSYSSGSEFFQIASDMDIDRLWPIMDELMETLQVLNPRLYNSVIRKLRDN